MKKGVSSAVRLSWCRGCEAAHLAIGPSEVRLTPADLVILKERIDLIMARMAEGSPERAAQPWFHSLH